MRKKYFVPIGILLLILVISILIIVEKKNKTEKDEAVPDESVYITEEQMKEIERKKEELACLCEENKEELEAMSKEYLVLMEELGKSKEELTYEDFEDMDKQVKNTKGEDLADLVKLDIYIPDYAVDNEDVVCYRYWCKWGYELDLVYIDKDAEKVLEYVESFDGYWGEIVKVNEYLYVYLRTFMGV